MLWIKRNLNDICICIAQRDKERKRKRERDTNYICNETAELTAFALIMYENDS